MNRSQNSLDKAVPLLPDYQFIEAIYQGSRTLVYRAVDTKSRQSVVIKTLIQEYPSIGDLIQFRNQYTIAKNLSLPGIIQPLALITHGNRYNLVMEDYGGISIDKYIKNRILSLSEILDIGQQLAHILHDLCQCQIIHKDIKPANILIKPSQGNQNSRVQQVKLIDFSLASLLPQETQYLQSPKQIEGTLAYLAPEQTGRMNRGIDYRTDFYGLGVTLYQLLTGQLPFQSQDPLELIHCHLAQVATPVHEVNPEVPAIVGKIVAKLMAKNAENRYQSALAIEQDLEKCQSQWRSTQAIKSFNLGQRDFSDRFLISEKLYGRESEVQQLLDAFETTMQGMATLFLVAGYSGVGKTAVINEVHKPIVRQRGYFIKGKFDQFNRSVPFLAFIQAFGELVTQLLSESDVELIRWKQKLLIALGENSEVITDIIPNLEQILGAQPPAPKLSGVAAQNRFNRLLQNFIQVIATDEHPLVIFIDDLQWADSASLDLIQSLMTQSQTSHLLLLGAYRDNEVFPAHPLIVTLENIVQTAPESLKTITLEPLNINSLNHLVGDTLHASSEIARPLSTLVMQKTQGNPFFAIQFLKALYQDKFISFNVNDRCWQCDLVRVQEAALTDDVVQFMAGRLKRLQPETQDILKLAACVGAQFDLETLAIIAKTPHAQVKLVDFSLTPLLPEVIEALWPALQEGLILPRSETYKFYMGENLPDVIEPSTAIVNFKFLHDRVQQAAYSLIPDAQKQGIHYQIGKRLQHCLPTASLEEHIFDVVGHLNLAHALITIPQEREDLARLNLHASDRARHATAYRSAQTFAHIGISLLAEDPWHTQYDLTLALHNAAAESAYLNGDYEAMNKVIESVLKAGHSILDKTRVYLVKIEALAAQNNIPEAMQVGHQALTQVGVDFSPDPDDETIEAALQGLTTQLEQQPMESLLELPSMEDPYSLAALDLLATLMTPVFVGRPQCLPILGSTIIQLSLSAGNAPASTIGYATCAMVLSNFLDQIDQGYTLGKLAVTLGNNPSYQEYESLSLLWFGSFLQHHKESLRIASETLKLAYLKGLEIGDFTSVGYSLVAHCTQAFFAGVNLEKLDIDLKNYCGLVSQIKQEQALRFMTMQQQLMLGLMVDIENPDQFLGPAYNESLMLPIHYENQEYNELATVFVFKLVSAYLFGHHERSLVYITEAAKYLDNLAGLTEGIAFHFYAALTYLASPVPSDLEDRSAILSKIEDHQLVLSHWAEHAPMNYQHKVDLVEAEKQRWLGNFRVAADCYDLAIVRAKNHQYNSEEALANELTAKFYWAQGRDKIAAGYMQDAYYAYGHWGAISKVEQLERIYGDLLRPILQTSSTTNSLTKMLTSIALPTVSLHSSHHSSNPDSWEGQSLNQTLDLTSILQASQALSTQIDLDKLLKQLTRIILHTSGGDFCALVLGDDRQNWNVKVKATALKLERCDISLEDSHDLPIKLIQYVKNTQDIVSIDDSEVDLPISDPYLERNRPHSILCLPLLRQGNLVGLVYVSNQGTQGVFSQERIVVLNFLCTQAAISLENARLYDQSQRYGQDLEKSLADLKVLEAEQQRLVDVLEATPDYIAVFNNQGDIIWQNQPLRALYSLGNSGMNLSNWYPKWVNQIIQQEALSTAIAQGSWSGELALLDDQGQEIPVSQVIIAHKSTADKIEYFSTIMRDIRDRKAYEASLENTNLELLRASRMKDEFLATMSHELRTPLNAVLGMTEALQEEILGPLNPRQQNALSTIEKSGSNLLNLIGEILDLSQISANKVTIKHSPTNIVQLCEASLQGIRPQAHQKQLEIQVIIPSNLPLLQLDAQRLKQVLANLLSNGVKFTPEGGTISLQVMGTTATEIADDGSSIPPSPTYLQITVKDTGIGIAAEDMERIFHPFIQVDSALNRRYEGTGLGLALVKSIVELHQGTIQVKSTLGQGSTFVVHLPWVVAPSSESVNSRP